MFPTPLNKGWECNGTVTLENWLAVCCKVIHACSTYDPAIPPVGMKACGYTKICT